MENDKFDNIIKKALENLEAEFHTADWSAMEKQLDLDEHIHSNEMDDVMIDTMVFGNLENLEVPYKEENWKIMEAKLDEEFSFRKSIIYRYKLAEVALMLLAIFTLFQYIPLHKQDAPEKDKVVSNEQQMNFFSENTISLTEEKSNDNLQNKNSDNNNNTSQQINSSTNQKHVTAKENLKAAQKQVSSTVQNSKSTISKEIPNTENTSTRVLLSNHSLATNFNLQNAIVRIQKTNAKILQEISTATSLPFKTKFNIPSLAIANLELFDIQNNQLSEQKVKFAPKPIDITVGMFATGDYNFINTPYDEIFSAKATRTGDYGYSGGLSLGFSFGKWQLETGFIYSSKVYKPKTNPELYGTFDAGYVTEKFVDFELDILQIPLNLQYSLTNSNKWRLYSSLGGSLNTLIQANYDRIIEPEPGFVGLRPGAGASSGIKEIREQESNLYTAKEKESPKGLFEGGSFRRNSYVTINLGFGIERNLSPRWSTFFETSYHHHLFSLHEKGIGPNSDNINTFELKAGAKVHLRQK